MTQLPTGPAPIAAREPLAERVLFYSPFERAANVRHGGVLRHEQLKSLAAAAGYSVSLVSDFCRQGLPPVTVHSLRGALYPLSWIRPSRVAHAVRLVAALHYAYRQGIRCLVHEHHFHTFPQAIRWARNIGFKVVTCPHNIESLIPGQYDRLTLSSGERYLKLEMKLLACAHERFFIARNDAWLAANYGAPGHHLPYRPPHPDDEIRDERAKSEKRGYLALASATNPVSREGLLELLAFWSAIPRSEVLHIAGNGTDSIAANAENVVIHGRVSDQALAELYEKTKAIVAHQCRGTGALTRIPEALSNGIPVLANPIAFRDCEMLSGVYEYRSPSELAHLLELPLPTPPAPALDAELASTFVAALAS